MEPVTLTLVVVAVIGAFLGGLGFGQLAGGGDTDVTITDAAGVEGERTEQVYSYERAVIEVCGSDFIAQHGTALCEQALCLADQREGSQADNDTCDRAASYRVKKAARDYCDMTYPVIYTEAPTQPVQTLQERQAKQHAECLAWFVVEK